MSRIVYVNGEYLPEEDAKISIFDRGFLFADAVYEVTAVLDGKLIDIDAHMVRLARSRGELGLEAPCSDAEIIEIHHELMKRNNLTEGGIYLQVTRGAADRDFAFPKDAKPSLVMFTQAKSLAANPTAGKGIAVKTVPDIRWKRRDIKSVGLLPASMAKQTALDAGADDAWMVEDGYVTEGSSNNAFIVTEDGKIITRQLGNEILHGITRKVVLELARQENLTIEERAFTPEEAYDAKEAFFTSSSAFVMPVVKIDGHILGNGVPGPIAEKLRELYLAAARES